MHWNKPRSQHQKWPYYLLRKYNISSIQGTLMYRKGKVDEAIKNYDLAIQLEPNCAEAYYNKGCALENQGKIDESNKCYEKAF